MTFGIISEDKTFLKVEIKQDDIEEEFKKLLLIKE